MKGLKTGGRKPGSRNKTSSEIRLALLEILGSNLERLKTIIEGMPDPEAAKTLLQLARHLTFPEVSPEKLSEDQLKQLYEFIKKENDYPY